MKTILFRNSMTVLVAVIAVLFISSCGNTEEKTIVKCITYDVLINSDNNHSYAEESWWRNNIERSKREAYITLLFEKIDTNEIKVTNGEGKELTMEDIQKRMIIKDTVVLKRTKEPFDYYDTVISLTIKPEQINTIRFKESWTYDPETYKITKHLLSYGLSYVKQSVYSRPYHPEPFFWVSCTDEENFSNPKKVLTERISYTMTLFEQLNIPQLNTIKIEGDTNDIREYLKSNWEATLNGTLKNVKNLEFIPQELIEMPVDSIRHIAIHQIRKNCSANMTEEEIEKGLYDYIMNYGKSLFFHERWLVDMNTMEIKKEVQVISPGIVIYKNGLMMGTHYCYSLAFKNTLWQPL